jgi:hypothetical protein
MRARAIYRCPAVLGCAGAVAASLLGGCAQDPDSEELWRSLVDAGPRDPFVRDTSTGGFDSAFPGMAPGSEPAPTANLSCSSSTTLESLIDCISGHMPAHDSDGFVAPSSTQRAALQSVVERMVGGECDFTLPASLRANMAIRTFTDSSNGRSYCLLMEVTSTGETGVVDKGWGTFITYPNATRELSQQAPHPKFDTSTPGSAGDSYTEREAIRIFKRTDSRSFLMAGARRSANMADSSCQSAYYESDCAHNTNTMFFAVNRALNDFYGTGDWTAIQWHAKAASTCDNEVFMSIGLDANPPLGSKVLRLKARIEQERPAWVVQTPRRPDCDLNATKNTQGRLLNGVAASKVCSTAASAPSHEFMHIEQTVGLLGEDLDGVAGSWANAIIAAFPASS